MSQLICGSCGATNMGEVTTCLLCQAPLDGSASPVAIDEQATEWQPTHRVPLSGLPAYAEPDPSAAPVATLDPALPVEVAETYGDWSRIVCSNGWAAWVDGRALEQADR